MAHLDFGHQADEYERHEEQRRRRFIERMEQKLRFKESMYRTQHRHVKLFLK